ncbi:MAG: phosphohistidine phosphatase SixA [Ramlibacter sp.]
MDLILWRHAEAHDLHEGQDDLQRALTARGEKQAARMGAWLDRLLPEGAQILCSPALRCEQTAKGLGRKFRTRQELAPGATAVQLLAAAQWPDARRTVLVVGHQPTLGEAVASLLSIPASACHVRKAAAWWLRTRNRDGGTECIVVAVQGPDFL